MELSFTCNYSCDEELMHPYINIAVFELDGNAFIIDRDETWFTINRENHILKMDWLDVYIWNGEYENYNIPEEFADKAILKGLEIEAAEDVPISYTISNIVWSIH